MIMNPGTRKLALTAHVTTSVGWMGAVAAFLALSIAGMASDSVDVVRSAYVAMNVIGAAIIVPLSAAALVTGLVQGLGTQWGLFRHYWVATKLVLTVVATVLLLLHQYTAVAGAARRVSEAAPGAMPHVGGLGVQLVVDAGAALVLLLVTTTLSIYKPWGRTSYGRRVEASAAGSVTASVSSRPLGFRIFLAIVGAIVAAIIIIHLAGGGLRHH